VVLLNNDTVPQPGWLDALLDTFGSVPDAGLVGSQLLYPDGRLQESGGVIFADGSGWSYGRFEAAEDPRFASLRDVDYCSARR
jgi:GT2 family glycosyltransferase